MYSKTNILDIQNYLVVVAQQEVQILQYPKNLSLAKFVPKIKDQTRVAINNTIYVVFK